MVVHVDPNLHQFLEKLDCRVAHPRLQVRESRLIRRRLREDECALCRSSSKGSVPIFVRTMITLSIDHRRMSDSRLLRYLAWSFLWFMCTWCASRSSFRCEKLEALATAAKWLTISMRVFSPTVKNRELDVQTLAAWTNIFHIRSEGGALANISWLLDAIVVEIACYHLHFDLRYCAAVQAAQHFIEHGRPAA